MRSDRTTGEWEGTSTNGGWEVELNQKVGKKKSGADEDVYPRYDEGVESAAEDATERGR